MAVIKQETVAKLIKLNAILEWNNFIRGLNDMGMLSVGFVSLAEKEGIPVGSIVTPVLVTFDFQAGGITSVECMMSDAYSDNTILTTFEINELFPYEIASAFEKFLEA